jgi:hypothetical protein
MNMSKMDGEAGYDRGKIFVFHKKIASDIFDRNQGVISHTAHAHSGGGGLTLKKEAGTRVSQPKFRPASAQQKSAVPGKNIGGNSDFPKADVKQVRPQSGIKPTK